MSTIGIDPSTSCSRHGTEAVLLVQPACRLVGLAGRDDPALRVGLPRVERVEQRAGDAAAEAVGVHDEAVDVDEARRLRFHDTAPTSRSPS